MTTDYKKLKPFESAIIAMIIVGAFIIGFEFYSGLPKTAQVSLTSAVNILDVHEDVAQDIKIAGLASDLMVKTYDQINLAAAQIFDLGDEMNQFADLYQSGRQTASAYWGAFNQYHPSSYAYQGAEQVLGASITAGDAVGSIPEAIDYSAPQHYGGYKVPDMDGVKQYISSFEINK